MEHFLRFGQSESRQVSEENPSQAPGLAQNGDIITGQTGSEIGLAPLRSSDIDTLTNNELGLDTGIGSGSPLELLSAGGSNPDALIGSLGDGVLNNNSTNFAPAGNLEDIGGTIDIAQLASAGDLVLI